jgi:hypothetical protein
MCVVLGRRTHWLGLLSVRIFCFLDGQFGVGSRFYRSAFLSLQHGYVNQVMRIHEWLYGVNAIDHESMRVVVYPWQTRWYGFFGGFGHLGCLFLFIACDGI